MLIHWIIIKGKMESIIAKLQLRGMCREPAIYSFVTEYPEPPSAQIVATSITPPDDLSSPMQGSQNYYSQWCTSNILSSGKLPSPGARGHLTDCIRTRSPATLLASLLLMQQSRKRPVLRVLVLDAVLSNYDTWMLLNCNLNRKIVSRELHLLSCSLLCISPRSSCHATAARLPFQESRSFCSM